MKKITLSAVALFAGLLFSYAQSACNNDLNGFPQSKNVASEGAVTLTVGTEENAAQTYHYSGPGRIMSVRIYGFSPNIWGIDLAAKIYQVDASGRPMGPSIASRTFHWDGWDNWRGYTDINFTGGVEVHTNFATAVEIVGGVPFGSIFQVKYNGNGEGLGQDLASMAGTSTGFNWTSAKDGFSKNGDFYIVPNMRNYNDPEFSVSSACVGTNSTVNFTNLTEMTTDSMFNTIGLKNYSGSEKFYTWNFGDGSPVSNATNPSHTYTVAGAPIITLTSTIDGWNASPGGICKRTYTVQISVGLTVAAASTSSVTCHGGNNGSIVASSTGGATPYKWSLDGTNYQSGTTFSNLTAGTYTLYAKDKLDCIKTTTVIIAQPTPIVFGAVSTTNASCTNSDGSIVTSATGGVGTLQYSLNGSSWQSTGTFTGLAASGYTVYVKDANSCSKSISTAVINFGSPVPAIVSYTQVSCNSGNDGSIIVTATGGTGVLQYSVNGTTYQSTGTFYGLSAGVYTVYVKDANGCINTISQTLLSPPQLVLTASATGAVSCNGGNDGQITVTSTTGGTGVPDYSVNGTNYQVSGTFSGLTAGTYTVYARDVANCIATVTVNVTQPAVMTASVVVVNASCNGTESGSITIIPSGGTPGYQFSINGGDFSEGGVFSELAAGTYTIVIVDQNGCSMTTTPNITQPVAISAVITVGNSTCGNPDGNILAIAGGGSGSLYTYSIDGTNWNGTGSFTGLLSGAYVVYVKDGALCENIFECNVVNSDGPVIQTMNHTNVSCNGGSNGSITVVSVTGGTGTLKYSLDGSPLQLSNIFSNVTAGNHLVVVSDGNNCSGSQTITITEPAAIVVTTNVTNVLCNGDNSGSVQISAGGGSGTLAYSLKGGAYQSSNIFTGLYAGTYIAYVKDAGGCIGQTTFFIYQAPAITINSVGYLNVTCNGANNGSVYVIASGGTGSLTYSINGTTYQSSHIFTGLAGGNYTLYIKDAASCIKTTTVTLTEPAALINDSQVYNVTCAGGNDGVINLAISGGVPAYSYAWSNGATTEDIFNLVAGSYTVTVTDANGCKSVIPFVVTQPANAIVVNGVITNATGSGSADGAINITTTGGTAPYIYTWSNGASTEDITGLNPGAYVVTVKDVNGCVTSGIFNVSSPTGTGALNDQSFSVNLYPNPSSDYLVIEGDVSIDRLEIVNLLGEVVYAAEPRIEKVQLNTSEYAPGMYFIKLSMNGGFVTKRIQVNR